MLDDHDAGRSIVCQDPRRESYRENEAFRGSGWKVYDSSPLGAGCDVFSHRECERQIGITVERLPAAADLVAFTNKRWKITGNQRVCNLAHIFAHRTWGLISNDPDNEIGV
jgi:hypothetical protein